MSSTTGLRGLDGRSVLVTGAASGIGRAIAMRLAREGARVGIVDLDADAGNAARDAIRADGGRADAYAVDITDFEAVEEAVARFEADAGRIDGLVNNAGWDRAHEFLDTEPDFWRKVIDIDLNGVFYCCKAVVPHMIEGGYGRIVNTASIAGKEGNPNAAHYSAAKAGVIALTKSLGKELATHDIAVNCITPAAARTAIFDQVEQYHIDYMLSKIPRGRFVTVEEIANMVTWLASAENSFTTGAAFDLSGGRATY